MQSTSNISHQNTGRRVLHTYITVESLITMFKLLLILIRSNLVSSKLVWLVSVSSKLLLFFYQLSIFHSFYPIFTDPIRISSRLTSGYLIKPDLDLSDLDMSDLVWPKYTNPHWTSLISPCSNQSLSASARYKLFAQLPIFSWPIPSLPI